MSSYLHCNVLRNFSEDDWIAKTYSEYLMSCAQTKLDVIDDIQEVTTDEDLETIIENLSDSISDDFQECFDVVSKRMSDESTYPSLSIDWTDPQFNLCFINWIKDTDQGIDWWNDFKISYTLPDLTEYSDLDTDYEKFAKYMSEHTLDEIIACQPSYLSRVNTLITSCLINRGFNEYTDFTLNSGCVKMKELLTQLTNITVLDYSNPKIVLHTTGFDDEAIDDVEYALNDFWTETKTNLASTLAWAEGFASCAIANLTDAVTKFKSNIESYFSDISSYINNSVNVVKSTLANCKGSVSSFISQASEMLGWDKIGEDIKVVDETDMSQYTGASPYGDISLNTAKNIAVATGKTIAAAAIGIWTGLKALAIKAWNKVRPYVKAITTDPEDIAVVDDKQDSYTYENFMYNGSSSIQISINDWNGVKNNIQSKIGKWITYQSLFGEMQFCIDNIDTSYATPNFEYSWKYKPRVMDTIAMMNAGLCTLDVQNLSLDFLDPVNTPAADFVSKIDNLKLMQYRLPDDSTEEQKLYGTNAATLVNYGLIMAALKEVFDSMVGGEDNTLRYPIGWYNSSKYGSSERDRSGIMNYWKSKYYGPSIAIKGNEFTTQDLVHWEWDNAEAWNCTNKSALASCCGYYFGSSSISNDDKFKWYPRTFDSNVSDFNCDSRPMEYMMDALLSLFIIQRCDKTYNPEDYLFVPYSEDNYSFMEPRYRIKTDAENQNIAQIFVTVVTVVAVVVLAVLICKKIVSTFKKKKWYRLNMKKGVIDNAMWNGAKVLPDGSSINAAKNIRKYNRYTKKLDKMSNSISGLASGTSVFDAVEKVSNSTANFNNVINATNSESLESLNSIYRAISGTIIN